MAGANKMADSSVKKLIWSMGLPMVASMVLQGIYNVVDTAFVANMEEGGAAALLALTYAFPVQIFMIAIGVGLGIGVNALISSYLGAGQRERASKAAYNGIFLALCFYVIFLIFGLFFAEGFISMQAASLEDGALREQVIKFGTDYLSINCIFSFGQILFAVFERFLQGTGRTMYSTIGQIAGALTNIVLDYVFIFPCGMGVAGAAYATIIGQILSAIIDFTFHLIFVKEIDNKLKNLLPEREIIKAIFVIGLPAMIMQALISINMLGINLILGTSSDPSTITGAYGIYFKVQQIALFACFGMSNTLITIVSYNYALGKKERVVEATKWGIVDTLILSAVIFVLFEAIAVPLSQLFGMAGGDSSTAIVELCALAIWITSPGFIFMGFSVACQGVLQGLREVFTPLIISILRLVVFIFPLVYIFLLSGNNWLVWVAFPIAEAITAFISFFIIRARLNKRLSLLDEKQPEPVQQSL